MAASMNGRPQRRKAKETMMANMINVFQPSLGAQELAAVQAVFESNWVGRGEQADTFETAFARHIDVGRKHLTSVNSCTEATFIAMELAGIGPGDEVVLPTVSFVGVGNAIASRGARPVFCDVDLRTLNPTVADVEAVLTSRTKAVIILHYGGYPGDVVRIAALCRDRGILLIEDSAIAVASKVDGVACGTFGDMSVWSFDHGKIVVSVDGGMLYVRDPELAERAPKLAYFGLEQKSGYDQALRRRTRWWDFEVSSFSRRSVLNDVLAAIGNVQLGRLPEFIDRRRAVAAQYDAGLADLDGLLCPPHLPSGHESSYYMYWVQLDGGIRDEIARDLYERGVYTTFRYPLLHKVKAYGASGTALPNADAAADRTLLLPMHQALTSDEVARTIAAVRDCVRRRRQLAPARKAG
jgi:aminotransferase